MQEVQEVVVVGRGSARFGWWGCGGESFPKVEAASIGVKTVGERRAQPGEG